MSQTKTFKVSLRKQQNFNATVQKAVVLSDDVYKGTFATSEELINVSARKGDYADIYATNTRWEYDGQAWFDTGVQIPVDLRYALKEDVDDEISRLDNADDVLLQQIQAEIANRTATDETLATSLQAEVERANAAEGALNERVDATNEALNDEVVRATQAEATLHVAIDDESTTRALADQQLSQALQTETNRAQAAEQANVNAITEETSNRALADQHLADAINAEATSRITADQHLADNKLDKAFTSSVVKDVEYAYDEVDDSTKLTITNVNTASTIESTNTYTLQKATSTKTGLMPKESVVQLDELGIRVSSLEGKQYLYMYTASANPTASDIDNFVIQQGGTQPFSGVEVIVEQTKHIWRYYQNDGIGWRDDGIDSVAIATDTTIGVVKGTSDTAGKVYVEADGTMSLLGYDELVDNDANLTNAIQTEAETRALADNVLADEVDTKLTKNTSTDMLDRAYVVTSNGEQALKRIDDTPSANTIAKRNADGQLSSADPTQDEHVATKMYIDAEINDVNNALLSEQTARTQADTALGERIDDIVDGATTVGKATADGNGNVIANTYLPKTATVNTDQIADGSITNPKLSAAVQEAYANSDNLVLNGNFKINQQGQASYTGNGIYTVDGWKCANLSGGNTTVYYNANGSIRVVSGNAESYFYQYFDLDKFVFGIDYVLAVAVNGVRKTATGIIGNTNSAYLLLTFDNNVQCRILKTASTVEVGFVIPQNLDITINNVYFNKGTIAPPYKDPDPTLELLRCQKYYLEYNNLYALVIASSYLVGHIYIYLPTELNATKTTDVTITADTVDLLIDTKRFNNITVGSTPSNIFKNLIIINVFTQTAMSDGIAGRALFNGKITIDCRP